MSPYAVDPLVAPILTVLCIALAVGCVVLAALPAVAEHARRRAVGPHRRGLDALTRITRGDHR